MKQTTFGRRGEVANPSVHCRDVILSEMASQITSLTIVYSAVYPGADQRKHQSSTGKFPAQRATDAENVSI